jgi:hypothetical protein
MEEQEKVLMGQRELKRWHLMKMVEVVWLMAIHLHHLPQVSDTTSLPQFLSLSHLHADFRRTPSISFVAS